jgi:hypothetical protein
MTCVMSYSHVPRSNRKFLARLLAVQRRWKMTSSSAVIGGIDVCLAMICQGNYLT